MLSDMRGILTSSAGWVHLNPAILLVSSGLTKDVSDVNRRQQFRGQHTHLGEAEGAGALIGGSSLLQWASGDLLDISSWLWWWWG